MTRLKSFCYRKFLDESEKKEQGIKTFLLIHLESFRIAVIFFCSPGKIN